MIKIIISIACATQPEGYPVTQSTRLFAEWEANTAPIA